MAALTVASERVISTLVERCADTVLRDLAAGLRSMPGARARQVIALIQAEMTDRAFAASVFGAVAPMFTPRRDGVSAPTLPAMLGRAVWRELKRRHPREIEQAQPSCQTPEPAAAVLDRLCASAANLLRDEAPRLWPSDPDVCLEAARYFDLAPLTRRALPRLPAWTGRPDEAETAALRLMLRDAAEITSDGAPRALEILFANLAAAPLILRVISHVTDTAGDEAFLAASELADFGDRLFRSVEARADRVCAFDPGVAQPAGALAAADDLARIADLLEELALSLDLSSDGVWGRRSLALMGRVSKGLEALLAQCERAVDRALPLERVRSGGRLSRPRPRLDAPAEGPEMRRARALMTLFGAVRLSAATFGCGGRRGQVAEALSLRLRTYGDEAMEAVNAGAVDDLPRAAALIRAAADFLDLAGDEATARVLRRRLEVAEAYEASQDAA